MFKNESLGIRIKNTSNNLEPFVKPGNLCRAKKIGGIRGTLKPSLKTENLPGPGKIHRGPPGL